MLNGAEMLVFPCSDMMCIGIISVENKQEIEKNEGKHAISHFMGTYKRKLHIYLTHLEFFSTFFSSHLKIKTLFFVNKESRASNCFILLSSCL